MRKTLLRVPYPEVFSSNIVIPTTASTVPGAVAALQHFLLGNRSQPRPPKTLVLSGAGLSVASGLADYRGEKGTYRLNKTYRPIYYHEFLSSHEARKRYWARSFLGWTTLHNAKPNPSHHAVRDLGQLGLVKTVITQNVDSFHPRAHPGLPTIELHGYLRSAVCTSCHNEYPRDKFQQQLARLNPAWAAFLAEALASGALATEDLEERRAKGLRYNPDGDVDLPNAPYTTFRYPPCPVCLASPPPQPDGQKGIVEVDEDGAWISPSTAGILKPAVIMFGENIASQTKVASEQAIDAAERLLVLATSLATYSAWRLVKRARDAGKPLAILNVGGVRGEDTFFTNVDVEQDGSQGVRAELATEEVLPALVQSLEKSGLVR
jgi:NAD-dependent deacetylase sirtuin 4